MTITIVSGLPRSGTSLMMQMLATGGIPVLTDHARIADVDNPRGYYEFERVKALPEGDIEWLGDAQGRAVKVISALLPYLPATYTYRILFMERDLEEVLASQRLMLERRGAPLPTESEEQEMRALFSAHLRQTTEWLAAQPNLRALRVPYGELVRAPGALVREVVSFCGGELDEAAMTAAIDNRLYRNKRDTD